MCISELPKKLFGVALDPADDPWTIRLKQAWMSADTASLEGLAACLDPYDAITSGMAALLEKHRIEPAGRFPVPSWLRPKPDVSDFPIVTPENMRAFFDSRELEDISRRLRAFVEEKIFPDIPIMAGVDHSATAGVVEALSGRYGPGDLAVVVLDQHFDAIPLSVRIKALGESASMPVGFSDQFCCGNFWAYLVDSGAVLPENLNFIGVADYPSGKADPVKEPYRNAYLDFEKRGAGFFPQERFREDYRDALVRFIEDRVRAPRVYVSLDLDVGSYASTHAARYMDRPGLSQEEILFVAGAIVDGCRAGRYTICGLDIVEFNMHFLGIDTGDSAADTTLELVGKYLSVMT
jgi:arginase family enzyme